MLILNNLIYKSKRKKNESSTILLKSALVKTQQAIYESTKLIIVVTSRFLTIDIDHLEMAIYKKT
jgi:hypothetical protein